MARKHNLPPRRKMAEISGRLGIEDFTISSGGSVLRDFLEEVADVVGTALPSRQYSSKDKLLGAIVSSLTGRSVEYVLDGGTVTNDQLDDILVGLDEVDVRTHDTSRGVESAIPDAFDVDVDDMADARRTAERIVRLRERAPQFRKALLNAYGRRCAMTGADAVITLEAAHIYPYRGSWTNAVQNGLLLRADVHRAFDGGMLAVNTLDWSVLVSDELAGTSLGAELSGRTVRLPDDPGQHPKSSVLDQHRAAVGL